MYSVGFGRFLEAYEASVEGRVKKASRRLRNAQFVMTVAAKELDDASEELSQAIAQLDKDREALRKERIEPLKRVRRSRKVDSVAIPPTIQQ